MKLSTKIAIPMLGAPLACGIMTNILHMPPIVQGLAIAVSLVPAWEELTAIEREIELGPRLKEDDDAPDDA